MLWQTGMTPIVSFRISRTGSSGQSLGCDL